MHVVLEMLSYVHANRDHVHVMVMCVGMCVAVVMSRYLLKHVVCGAEVAVARVAGGEGVESDQRRLHVGLKRDGKVRGRE